MAMAVAVAFLLLGFLLGLLSLAIAEGVALLWAIRSLNKRGRPSDTLPVGVRPPLPRQDHDLPKTKRQGFLWILEQGKTPKDHPANGGRTKEKRLDMEVFPVKMLAQLEGHLLSLSGTDGSQQQLTIEMLNYTVVAVSASNLHSRKWAKRYPIKLQSKEESQICSGSKACYVYADTSSEKESWCKALRLASTTDKDKLDFHAMLTEEFSSYVSALNAGYPCFPKPSTLSGQEQVVVEDNTVRTDGSSRVRSFLKRLAKKASIKASQESKTSPAVPSSKQDTSIKRGTTRSSSVSLGSQQSDLDSHNAEVDGKLANDGTLCWNLLISRLFFDAKMDDEVKKAIKARIQRTLSNTRTPAYIGDITLTHLNLGKLPPYLHGMRVLPLDLNEPWAFEVDFEYSSGMLLQIETRLEVREQELEKDIMKTSIKGDSNGNVSSDFLDSIEQYGNQFRSSEPLDSEVEGNDEADALRKSKSTGWTSTYMQRWKTILHSIADQVSQVPLSLAIKISSIHGTLRVHIKPPPSDRIWFGFVSMPEIEWELESAVGDRKITSSHITSLISNRIKASVRQSLVLPNCESIPISWMISDTDDWVPRKVAPFIWLNRELAEANNTRRATDTTRELPGEAFASKSIAKSKSSPPSSTTEVVSRLLNKSVDGPEQAEASSTSWHWQSCLVTASGAPPIRSNNVGASETRDEQLRMPLLGSSSSSRPLPYAAAAAGEGDAKKRKRGGRRARVMHFVGKIRENARSNSLQLLPDLERATTTTTPPPLDQLDLLLVH